MLDLTWKIFSETGNIDTYLLMKEIERDNGKPEDESEELAEINTPLA
ncbi:YqzL family protein [Bacillus tianshenii]|nr:YqzL family protein [Bacillus tianshenii]